MSINIIQLEWCDKYGISMIKHGEDDSAMEKSDYSWRVSYLITFHIWQIFGDSDDSGKHGHETCNE